MSWNVRENSQRETKGLAVEAVRKQKATPGETERIAKAHIELIGQERLADLRLTRNLLQLDVDLAVRSWLKVTRSN